MDDQGEFIETTGMPRQEGRASSTRLSAGDIARRLAYLKLYDLNTYLGYWSAVEVEAADLSQNSSVL
jgi:hypothetical protein